MSMTVPSPSRLELVGGKVGDRHVPVRSPGRRSFCRTRPLGLVKVSAENRAQADPALSDMPLVRKGNRLSVMPVSAADWRHILTLE